MGRFFFMNSADMMDLPAWSGHGLRVIANLALVATFLLRYEQTRREVRASTQRFQTLFENVADPILVVDAQTDTIMEVNQAAAAFYGYARGELIGSPTALIIHESEQGEHAGHVGALASATEPQILERRHVTRAGVLKLVRCHIAPVDYNGRAATVTIVADMTAWRQLESDLRRSQADLQRRNQEQQLLLNVAADLSASMDLRARLDVVLEALAGPLHPTHCSICLLDSDGKTLRFVARWQAPGAPVGAPPLAVPLEARPALCAAIRTATPQQLQDVPHHEMPDELAGHVRELGLQTALYVPLVRHGSAIGALVISSSEPERAFTDDEIGFARALASQAAAAIESARLFDEVAQSEAMARAVIEEAGRAIIIYDRRNAITVVNQEACALLGADRSQLIGRDASSLRERMPADGEEDPLALDALGRAEAEVSLVRQDGTAFPAEVSIVTVSSGPTHRHIAIFHDITQRREAEARMLQTERLRALGQMATGIAHDVKNTLSSVLGWAQLALTADPSPDVAHALEVIERSASNGTETLLRIQQFAHAQASTGERIINVNDIVAEAAEATRPRWEQLARAQGVVIRVEHDLGEVPPIRSNPADISEILLNLIVNACDAMPEGGTLMLRTRTAQGAVCIEVADTGVGVPVDLEVQIFEPFFSTKGTENSGLGLSMSRGIAERLGGELGVDSTPGQGTTMTLSLPVGSGAGTEGAPRSGPAVPVAARPEILIVEDDDTTREMLMLALESQGYQPIVVASAADAIATLDRKPMDVVITDLGLPDLTGWQVAALAKDKQPGIYVILITGWGSDVDDAAYPAVDKLLRKPIPLQALYEAIPRGGRSL